MPPRAEPQVRQAKDAGLPDRPTRRGWRWLPSRASKPAPGATVARDRRSDITVAALGVTIGLICALFPWYIFFNQDKFGIRALRFSGNPGENAGPITLYPQPDRIGAPMDISEIPPTKLDLFATGTALGEKPGDGDLPGVEDQPFPADPPSFHLVHVANGRAMIGDDSGLWLVQAGSVLPDNSKVVSIEQRDGRWVLVTSTDRILTIDN